jgi:hypothetical protein
MRSQGRKVTPKVVSGKVQKKNFQDTTFNYWDHDPGYPIIDRQRPGEGQRHLLTKAEIQKFIDILPDWSELSKGLKAIVLAPDDDCAGWCLDGIVAICGWDRELWMDYHPNFYKEHRGVLDRLGVETEQGEGGRMLCKYTENQAKAFQLLHIFLHELGHHHDRMTTKNKERTGRGEKYAEEYALKYMETIWSEYLKRFPLY